MHHIHFDTIDSTNTFAKKLVAGRDAKNAEPILITAEEQTEGRGRSGKTFSSLRGNGLYMSVVLPINRMPQDSLFITTAAAVAVCEVLRECGCQGAEIKWVNDIYLDDRKICGILTEAVTDPDSGIMRFAVVGIGINVDADERRFPKDIIGKAAAVTGLYVKKDQLAVRIADRLIRRVKRSLTVEDERRETLNRYREMSMIIGREVYWEENGRERRGLAVDIDDEAALIVDTGRGEAKLQSGYISISFR